MTRIAITLDDGSHHELEVRPGHEGLSLAALLAHLGFPLNTRCGRRGLCRGCEVALREGAVDAGGEPVVAPVTVRACQARVSGPLVIEIPARSRMEHRPQVGESFRIDVPAAHQPLFEPAPGGRDTAFAADIGTTTVVVLLVDLASGEVLARAGGFNEQIRFGDNVLTRIDAGRDPAAVRGMQEAVVEGSIAPLLARACERAGRGGERLAGGVVAGNTTMLHLLMREDPSPLGVAPFSPRFIAGRETSCGEIGLRVPGGSGSGLPLRLLPGIAGYIGADIVAGIYATGMMFDEAASLLVDIGTNGEVVLQAGGRLIGCATAAGPAFEGAGLRCGTRAREGAVGRLRVTRTPFRIAATVIGEVPVARAAGICGSAYIDFLATGRECGLLASSGRFESGAWDEAPPDHRLVDDDERAVKLCAGNGCPAVSEVDIAVLLQAKAAIGAGIETLLEAAGLTAREIGRVYLAGGFGMHLDVGHAIAIGLLPGFRAEQVEVVGNTALAGAVLALVDRTTLAGMEGIRTGFEVLELNLQDGFEDRFIDHLLLP